MFKFLPGTHHIDRPVHVRNIQNISLENFHDQNDQYPHVVAQFHSDLEVSNCDLSNIYDKSCDAISFDEVADVVLKGINVTVYTPNISAIVFWNVSNISVQSFTVYSRSSSTCAFGILVFQAKSVEMILVGAYYFKIAFFMENAGNIWITNITTRYNKQDGIYLGKISNAHITNVTTTNNGRMGIFLRRIKYVFLEKTTAMYNKMDGIYLKSITNCAINITITMHNERVGMYLFETNNTYIVETIAAYNNMRGMDMRYMNHTHITDVIATHNSGYGVVLNESDNICIRNLSLMYNLVNGMMLNATSNSNITTLIASYNKGNAFSVHLSRNIHIINASIQNNYGSLIFSEKYSLKFGYFFQLNIQISIWSSTETIIQNSSFIGINPPSSVGTTNPSTLPAIIAVYQSTLEISGCSFKQNHISAVRAHESNVTLSGNVVFSNNTAVSGTAFILVQGSIISLVKNSNVKFENNFAKNTGGVFYIGVNDYVYLGDTFSHRKCFLNIPVDRSQIHLIFVNNSAGVGGDILYGGQVAFALDGNWNCLESFENISTITSSQNDLSLISSDPSRVCFCDETRIPDCMIFSDTISHSFYPGQSVSISAVTVGQNFGTVTGSVYAQYLKRSPTDNLLELDVSQKIQTVTQKRCNRQSYTLFSPINIRELILVLTVDETVVSSENQIFSNQTKSLLQQSYHTSRIEPLLYFSNPVYINISILPCPLGFMLTTDPPFKCDCTHLLQQMPGVQCDIHGQIFGRSGLVWVGMTQNGNGTNGTVAASQYCPLNYCNKKDTNVTVDTPDSQCNYNHSGILCGSCQSGLSLALGSERCLPCSNKYLTLLIPFTLAGPLLVGLIKWLHLTVSQGTMTGLIFYANIIQANQYTFIPWRSTHILSTFIAWLNLDLGVEMCFFEGLNAYYKIWLQFVFPFYIWSIAGFIIILSKYSRRVARMMGNNSVPVLATLFLLSYAKLFSIIISALSYTILYTSDGSKAVWSADGNVEYLDPKHMLLFVVAVASLLFLWLPYTLILFLGQWLHMCNCRLIVRFLFKLKPFLDAHYAPLKDKHRYWFGALHLVRAAILLVSSLIPADHSSIVTISILASAVVIMYFGSVVHHKTAVAMFNMAFFLNLILISGASLYTQIVGGDSAAYAYPLIGLACLQYVGLIIFNVFSIIRKNSKVMAYFHVCMRQHVEDDWELFEQAALLRERESEFEEEGSEGSGSMESLPTY